MPVKKIFSIQIDGPPGGIDKPKRKWMEIITIDMKTCNLSEDLGGKGFEDDDDYDNNDLQTPCTALGKVSTCFKPLPSTILFS